MADLTLIVAVCAKICLIIISSVILSQLNTAYAASYKVILIFVTCAMTLLYCLATILVHIGFGLRCPDEITSFAIGEIVLAAIGVIAWLFVAGVAGSTAWRSGSDDSLTFGWISGLGGVTCFIFLVIAVIFAARIVMDKVVNGANRRSKAKLYNRR